jgi:hypothetical protein
MEISPIKTESDYAATMRRIEAVWAPLWEHPKATN